MTKRSRCHLCEQGIPTYRSGRLHGVRLEGIGMLDCACPIKKEDYDRMVGQLRDAVAEMKANPIKPIKFGGGTGK